MSRFFILGFATILAAMALSTVDAEEVEHPIYRSWARHPVGTAVTHKSVTTTDGPTIVTTTTTTLVELSAAKAVLETTTISNATGDTVEGPPLRYNQKRMFPLFPGVKKEDIGKPSGAIAKGEETLTLGGIAYQAEWFDSKGRTDAGETFTRTWMSDEVPGKLLKAVTRVPAAENTTTTVEMVEIKRP